MKATAVDSEVLTAKEVCLRYSVFSNLYGTQPLDCRSASRRRISADDPSLKDQCAKPFQTRRPFEAA
jgi:hypothetical protein